MKGVGRIAAVGHRVDKWFDDLVELNYRPWPAVGDQQRPGLGMGTALVDEVNTEAVDLGAEMVEPIQQRFADPPVIVLSPVLADFLHVRQRDALRPILDQLCLGPPGVAQPLP